jgi:hypothetical protein
MRRQLKPNGWALLILPGLMTSTALLLVSVPPAYATSCSTTGGMNGGNHYYAGLIDTTDNSGKFEGVGVSYTNMSSWTFNTPTSESIQLWWVSLQLPSHGWSQTGVGMGYLDGQTISSRSIFFEQSIDGSGTPSMTYVSSHTVPDKDSGYFEAWLYVGSNGDYWTTDEVSSSAEGTWSTNYDLGSSSSLLSYGTGQHSIETAYTTSLTCNQYAANSESDNLLYSTSLGTAPESSGSYWGSCSSAHNSPYSVSSSSGPGCISYATYSFSGG